MALVLGAVSGALSVPFWEGLTAWLNQRGQPCDFTLFPTEEAQRAAHFDGKIDVAWCSPLAWVLTTRAARRLNRVALAIAMRDVDLDRSSAVLVRAAGPIRALADLKGKKVAAAEGDALETRLIPLLHLAEAGGLTPSTDFDLVLRDERDLTHALLAGAVDAVCVADDTPLPEGARVLTQTAPYDRCVFATVGKTDHRHFVELLVAMSDDFAARPLLALSGGKAWRAGRNQGYAQLERAFTRFGKID